MGTRWRDGGRPGGRALLVALAVLAGFAAVAASRVAMLDSPYFEEIR